MHVRRRGRRLVVAHFPRRRRTLFRPGHLVVTHIFPVLDDPLEVVLDHPVDLRHQLLHQFLQRETAPASVLVLVVASRFYSPSPARRPSWPASPAAPPATGDTW